MLEARGIGVRLGRRQVLAGVDFTARAGEVTVIIGPNGSGKTTLLRAMTGDLPAAGEVRLNGLDTRRLKPWQLAAMRAVLPQATPLAFPFTVYEVVRLGLGAGREAGAPAIVPAALAAVGLSGYETRLYQELSGGEQSRTQLARALSQVWTPTTPEGPCWLLLDEPVASLDIGHQLEVMHLLRGYAARGGGVVAVMHDLNLTAMFADRVALMQEGRVMALDRPAAVLTDARLSAAYACPLRVNRLPPEGGVFVLPQGVASPVEA